MNTASLENCKRLYELSGWYDMSFVWRQGIPQPTYEMNYGENCEPAYDAGYLLRKLPETIPNMEYGFLWRFSLSPLGEGWCASYSNHGWAQSHKSAFSRKGYDSESVATFATFYADTPEDALCLLAIKLFEEGILKK